MVNPIRLQCEQPLPWKAENINIFSLVVTLCTTIFNIYKLYVLPTQCICVFYVDLRTNSDYFPIQH